MLELQATDDNPIQEEMMKRTEMLKEHIEGNIEILDYLQGISGLERDFSKLAERVINTAITLSDQNNVVHPERIYDQETGDNVDRCWKYISQLSEAIQFHIKKSHEYHKFHHEIWAARMEIQQVLSSYSLIQEKLDSLSLLTDEALETVKNMIEAQLSIYTKLSLKSKEFLAKSSIMRSIFLRNSLTQGKHSAYLLASLRLPSGQSVHRGDSVKVWGSNQFVSKLHSEWNAEVNNGEQINNAPSICFWLTSPEHSPISDKSNQLESCENEENHGTLGEVSSTKNVCKRFHKDLYSSWEIAINLFAKILMPTCTDYIKKLENIDQPIIVENSQEFNDFLNTLQTLLEYENEPELETLKGLSHRSHKTKDTIIHIKRENIHQLTETVKTWKILLQKFNEAVANTSENEANDQSLTTLKNEDLYLKLSPSVCKVTNKNKTMYPNEINRKHNEKQLITCFTENVPKTFTVNKHTTVHDHRIHESPLIKNVLRSQSDQMLENPPNFDKQTKELMTQIDSPFYSAVAYCTNCSEFHEISLLSPFICKPEASNSNLNSSSEVSDISEVRLKTAHSMPSLSIETKDSSVVDDRVSTFRNKKCSAIKKMSRSKGTKKCRPYSLNASLTETTASSGFDSPSESSISTKEKTRSQMHDEVYSESHRSRTSKRSFLWWYKRGKRTFKDESHAPESPNTEPGPPGRRSPLNITPSESVRECSYRSPTQFSDLNEDQANFDENRNSAVRSYSWIQQGTPWGYAPPTDSKWWPATQMIPVNDREKNKFINAYSDRIKMKSRKHAKRYSFENGIIHNENQMYNTSDSGIQTDMEVYISRQLDTILLDAESNNQRNLISPETVCQNCYKNIHKVYSEDSSVQCNFINDMILEQKFYHSSHSIPSKTEEKTDRVTHRRSKSNGVKVWDVCCQVGTVKQNRGTEPIKSEDIHSLLSTTSDQVNEYNDSSRMYARYDKRSKSYETSSRNLSQLNNAPSTRISSPLKFSVSCQIGPSLTVKNNVIHPMNQSCHESIEHTKKYSSQICNASSFTTDSPIMLGKKFQVNLPSSVFSKDISTQIQTVNKQMILANVSYVKDVIKSWLIESQSNYISSNKIINTEHNHKEIINHLTKTTDCHGLILLNETSTQIGFTNDIHHKLDHFYSNLKDNSVQTNLPHIYITETNIIPNWNSNIHEINKQFLSESKMINQLQKQNKSIKSLNYTQSLGENSSQLIINKSNQQINTKNYNRNMIPKNNQFEQTLSERRIRRRRTGSLNDQITVNKLKRIHKNSNDLHIKHEHLNKRMISTCDDLIMNIELHHLNCNKHSMKDLNYLPLSERLYNYKWLSLFPSSLSPPSSSPSRATSSSSSFNEYNDLCKQCRLKYSKPYYIHMEMIPNYQYNNNKFNHVIYHRLHHYHRMNSNCSMIKRSLSADDSKINIHKR
ncbi:hypothetical protein MS3_00004378 [Schistosoma haematobium]|uniref:Uncharacterized protein n=1 Tax=Schistosoma haematobium TaxID=6185 RepID=A0A922LSA5_SCHHA|nr:hypothetical protein MS3_00004378 [Schistosoma haematobium]KAH9592468.1 hypothetical protein MS3_00004378 [Schistosoma haematobium]